MVAFLKTDSSIGVNSANFHGISMRFIILLIFISSIIGCHPKNDEMMVKMMEGPFSKTPFPNYRSSATV
jgi:hypothetical protein